MKARLPWESTLKYWIQFLTTEFYTAEKYVPSMYTYNNVFILEILIKKKVCTDVTLVAYR